nr:immunoglobulin light chain junction region [Macaca mulatta]MOV75760.1 immunoglobulin light chain junction region [Macaca mulatta]MOV76926.1 immunoglobulin light chain junction region [Macaca mulatta]MOW11931.1 immunoglobulin light chain junction region [Macaca mulatta]MOW12450.1 immunoglobulin light chain junction region [Macaca mulatta]
CLQYNSDPLTF